MRHKRVLYDVYVGGFPARYVKSAAYSFVLPPTALGHGVMQQPRGLNMPSSKGSMENTRSSNTLMYLY